jgi:hypothetical protein
MRGNDLTSIPTAISTMMITTQAAKAAMVIKPAVSQSALLPADCHPGARDMPRKAAEIPTNTVEATLINRTIRIWVGIPAATNCMVDKAVSRAANTTLVQPKSASETARNNNGGKLLSVSKLSALYRRRARGGGQLLSLICTWDEFSRYAYG